MEYSEFVEWIAFYEAEPFGDSRSDILNASLAAVIVNSNRSRKDKRVKPSDFLIDWWQDGSKPAALMAKLRGAEARMKGNQREKAAKPKDNGTRPRNTRRRSNRRD